MVPALILALTLMAASAPPPDAAQGEPLPPGAPSDPYQLTGWCYGALAEYLEIYDVVKPDLVAIDKMFGSPVKEAEPYQSDVAAYRDELKIFAQAIEATEKASPQVISGQGAQAIRSGQGIWRQAELRSRRELARAWLSWGMPDQCDTNAKALLAKSTVLGKALSFNNGAASQSAVHSSPTPDAGALTLAPIAPVVTQDPTASGPALASANPPPMSSLPAAQAPVSPPPQDAPVGGTDVAAVQPSRVLGDTVPTEAPASAPAEAPPQPAPPEAVPAPAPQPVTPAQSAPPATRAAPSQAPDVDEPQEPVL
ncbi:MAG: hypothetical protein JSR86_03180 [Proteobacteria bacterium]|nr:hypothetical protein [Pseudomonadota bacterium]